MEKNVKGYVEHANTGISLDEWINLHVNPVNLKGEKIIKVTYGKGANND